MKKIRIFGASTCAACKTVKSVAEASGLELEYLLIDQDSAARFSYEFYITPSIGTTRELPLTVVYDDESASEFAAVSGLPKSLALIRSNKE